MNKNVGYSQEKALNQRECDLLLRGVRKGDRDLFRSESQFITFLGGRLGLRPSEITHVHEDGLNWRNHCIKIPLHDPCNQGHGGGLCNLCHQSVGQCVKYHDIMLCEARIQTANLVQILYNLQESVPLMMSKVEPFDREVDL